MLGRRQRQSLAWLCFGRLPRRSDWKSRVFSHSAAGFFSRKASDLTFLALFPCIRSNTFSQLVAEEYLSFFHFNGLPLDQALR